MNPAPSSFSRDFTLEPTDHPRWLRLEFHAPVHGVHRLVVETDWTEAIQLPGVSLYDLAATAVEVALSYKPDFRFPSTVSLGKLTKIFPNLIADVQSRLKR